MPKQTKQSAPATKKQRSRGQQSGTGGRTGGGGSKRTTPKG
jgi:hypothetical protein